ncbi:xanthine dehydrogenase family protein molybdopterin-binding subunit [Hyphococcus flavus]|uniref:Xanthine dehydrogenase family protein molybdopterin-binding subunit n=1 Tax=Hyphococcus flavus TaxID=1866326 RepID=A0AAF0CC39_9PROT|nr:xanthine dehydrogenase family protein molybdopterin-binding subunit [Hyphococcus flavus]WDI32500.1 xanthine dehydrogenase family protein molybdopterin-binding subunit [Hyphococcus flavus]
MAPLDTPAPSRRAFLAGASGLLISVALPVKSRAQSGAENVLGGGESGENLFEPNAFVRVSPDNTVTVLIKHIEFGQGPWTGLATLVADEMDADWSQIKAEHAPSNAQLYANAAFGPIQGTGGSTAMFSSYELMRKAGATAKAMLIAAAAARWGISSDSISVSNGVVSHTGSGRSATFGELAEAASSQTPPENPTLKTPDQFIYIGKNVSKLDTRDKSNGAAIFSLDVYRDGMQTVVAAHPQKFGATPASFDAAAALRINGVEDVKQVGDAVAVYARNTFAALKGRKALDITWDESAAETRSSEVIAQERIDAVKNAGATANESGTASDALDSAATTHEAEYVFPYLAHAPMEPLDGVIERTEDGGVEVWMGSQIQTGDHMAIAQVCGLTPDKVKLNTMLSGGSFGRRAQPTSHFAVELASTFMAAGGQTPIKLVWTREDDIQGGYYRPLTAHQLRGGLDADGNIIAWEQTIAAQSFLAGSPFEGMIQNGVDATMVEGAAPIPYSVPNFKTSAHIINNPVTTLWWRSVGHTHTGYAVETFIDELLEKAGKDPVAGRLALMSEEHARLAAVLQRAADMAGWGRAAPEGRAFGVAAVESFRSYVAQVAEVSIENGVPHVHNVWCAVDCGVAVNPEVVKAQMEGGIGYGLGAILFNELTLDEGGAVAQSNFHDYRSLRISEMPNVEVEIIPSTAPPTGVGEPGVPPIGPAVANAVRKLTGKTPRRLPMIKDLQA